MDRSVTRQSALPFDPGTASNPQPPAIQMASTSAEAPTPRYNCRPRKPVCYVDIQEPEFDEYVWCDECTDFVYEYCAIHGPVIMLPDDSVPADLRAYSLSMAELTLPTFFLHIAPSLIEGAGLGVFATLPMPKGVRFGPYRGVVSPCSDDSPYSWQVILNYMENTAEAALRSFVHSSKVIHGTSKKKSHIVNAEDPRRSNWMRYVNCSRFWREQNLVPFQYQGKLYYRTIKNIPRGRELLVFYGRQYAQLLGIDMRLYNAPRSRHIGIYRAPTRPPQTAHSQPPVSSKPYNTPIMLPRKELTQNTSMKKTQLETAKKKISAMIDINLAIVKYTCTFYKPEFEDVSILKQHIHEHATLCPYVCTKCYKCFETQTRLHLHSTSHNKETFQCNDCGKVFAYKATLIAHLRKLCQKSNHGTIVRQFVCKVCLKRFNSSSALSRHVSSHSGFRPFQCYDCHKSFKESNNLRVHMRIHTGAKPYTCNICSKAFNHSGHLSTHMRIHTGAKPYTCNICSKAFNHSGHLSTHMRIHTGAKPYTCNICSNAFNRSDTLSTHMRIHTGAKPYTCNICSKAFNQSCSLSRHMRIHTGAKPYTCNICSKAFNHSSHLGTHMRIHTGAKPYTCNICSKAFNHSGHLSTHMRIHTGAKPYTCNICSKAFRESGTLSRHMRIHTGAKPYTCNICSKAFNHSGHLSTHMRIHTGAKPYTCNICSKAFNQSCSLSRHMRIHTGAKPYTCNICSKAFNHSSHLGTHMRIHTGAKPYTCNICSKAFNHSGHLSTHMRIHTGAKPYTCNICSKAFRESGTLSRHMRIHTGAKPYTCTICSKAFNQSCNLSKHMTVHTRIRPYVFKKF